MMRMKPLLLGAAAVLLAACTRNPNAGVRQQSGWWTLVNIPEAAGAPGAWVVPSSKGQQTLINKYGFTAEEMIAPTFARRRGEACAGMRSVGSAQVGIGTIQLRVDEGEPVTIDPAGTLATGFQPGINMSRSAEAPASQAYTLACGDRGAALIARIKTGHMLYARQVAGTEFVSSAIEVPIDSDLLGNLAAAGL